MSEKWIRDTGLVFTLVCLVLAWRGSDISLTIGIILLLLVLFVPQALTPLAWIWKKIAEGLGFVMTKVFFGLVFFVVIVPVGFVRRIFYGDNRDFASQPASATAFFNRGETVVAGDLTKPF